jgi:hypothetical protein
LNQKRIYSRIKALFGVGERSEKNGGARERSGEESASPSHHVPAPEPHKEAPAKPPPPPPPPRRTNSLRSRLQRELDKGVALEQRVAHPLGFAGASIFMGPPTRQNDVEAWEARVERLLRDRPRSLSLFRYNEPTSGFAGLMVNPLDNPLRDRLRQRNIQLEKIIRDL